MIIGVNRR